MSEARQIEKVLKERTVQAVLTEDNVYSEFVYAAQCNVCNLYTEMQIRDETVLENNSPLPKHKS